MGKSKETAKIIATTEELAELEHHFGDKNGRRYDDYEV